MRRILVAAVLVACCSLPARADAPPAAARVEPAVRYPGLTRMLHRFRAQAEARARARVIAQR